ncbi:putative ubiquitin-conjugating enzyme E2 25 [Raphanus sativus]|nr:putative ubiquitin-conjugating enzyme E2 25 [Raphanus sativus]
MEPEIVCTTLTPTNKDTTPGAMQNGDVLDNNSVDNKNKGKAIQVGSLSDDEQLEESASEGYDTTNNNESDPGSSPLSDSLLDPDSLIYEDDSDQYGYEMEEEEEEADDYVSEYQALFDAKEKELPAGVEVTMDWLPNSKPSGTSKSSREEHGIEPEPTISSSSKKPKKGSALQGFTPNSAYALPQIYLNPQPPVPAPAPASSSSSAFLPTQKKPKGIYNARHGVQEVISDSNTCRVKRNMDDYLGKFVFFKRFDIVDDLVDHHYASNGTASTKHSKEWVKRIQEEWRILENDLPEMIFVRAYESRMDLLRAVIIGADGTPYHDGLFFFDIFFPDTYPSVPPYFEDFSYGHFFSCAHDVLKACNAYRNGAPVASLVRGKVKEGEVSDEKCSEKFMTDVATFVDTILLKEFILLGVLGLEPEEEDKPSETKVAESSSRRK